MERRSFLATLALGLMSLMGFKGIRMANGNQLRETQIAPPFKDRLIPVLPNYSLRSIDLPEGTASSLVRVTMQTIDGSDKHLFARRWKAKAMQPYTAFNEHGVLCIVHPHRLFQEPGLLEYDFLCCNV